MRSAASPTISATLKKLTTIGSKLSIRRRSRPESAAGKSTYWFIIRRNEEDLLQLDKEWDQVEMQLGWKLENCYRPIGLQKPSSDEGKHQSGNESNLPAPDPVAPEQLSTAAPHESMPTAPELESPKRLSPAGQPAMSTSNASTTNAFSDGATEISIESPD